VFVSYIYIAGDSYCFHRENIEKHWPAKLAELCSLQLEGYGFAGQGWWPVRKHLLDYMKSHKFEETEYFVFCHTDPNRLLSSNPIFSIPSSDGDLAKKIWHTYIQTDDVTTWCMQQWFYELNQLMQGKKVVHLQCFPNTQQYFSILEGIKFDTPLLHIAVTSAGGQPNTWGDREDIKKLMHQYHNHLSPEFNLRLAHTVHNSLLSHSNKQQCIQIDL